MTTRFDPVTEHYLASTVAEGLAAPATKPDLLARVMTEKPEYSRERERIERFINDLVDVLVADGTVVEVSQGLFKLVAKS